MVKNMFRIHLDTTSEYVIHAEKWPKPVCDVMVESLDMTEMAHKVFGTTPSEAYIDLYAYIEPARKLVTEFLMICKREDGTQDEMQVSVTEIADQVEYYMTLEYQGGAEFREFIDKACQEINIQRSENTSCLINIVEDFCNERGIPVPTPEERGKLAESFEEYLNLSHHIEMTDKLKALQWWAEKYNPDELDYYTVISYEGFTLKQIEEVHGKLAADVTREYWEEHGLSEGGVA